jgi:ATP-dependent RNA helicase DeaD
MSAVLSDETSSETPPPAGFAVFGLEPRLLAVLAEIGFTEPTPIQSAAIPALLAGRDVVGGARTGSGKTAAFGLPLVHRLGARTSRPQALVLCPTRELALQVQGDLQTFATALGLRTLAVYGGAPYRPQLTALQRGVDIVVGTPGRIIDHLDRNALALDDVRMVVLDEADEMLRMGFLDAVERILGATPAERQTALFSATMPPPIRRLAERFLRDPVDVAVEDHALSVEHIEQAFIIAQRHDKPEILIRVIRAEAAEGVLVFTNTRRDCAEVTEALCTRGIPAEALHGDLDQAARERVLGRFRDGRVNVLVATDVAARGLDVDRVEMVVNYELPLDAESYVHRIGRTARAGRAGVAISLVSSRERSRLINLQRRLGRSVSETRAPTEADVRKRELVELEADLVRAQADAESARRWVAERVLAGWDPGELAAAAVQAFADTRGLSFDKPRDDAKRPVRDERAPREDRPFRDERGPRDDRPARVPRADGPTKDLFLPIGKHAGVRPSDLVGALTHEAGVPFDAIGRITIHERVSYVVLDATHADRVVAQFPKLAIRGRESAVLLSSTARP